MPATKAVVVAVDAMRATVKAVAKVVVSATKDAMATKPAANHATPIAPSVPTKDKVKAAARVKIATTARSAPTRMRKTHAPAKTQTTPALKRKPKHAPKRATNALPAKNETTNSLAENVRQGVTTAVAIAPHVTTKAKTRKLPCLWPNTMWQRKPRPSIQQTHKATPMASAVNAAHATVTAVTVANVRPATAVMQRPAHPLCRTKAQLL